MTPDQRTKLTQGIVFGVFFQYLGYFIRDVSTKNTPPYFGGVTCMIMGFIIFAWGCSHLVAAKRLPKWANVLGLLSLIGLAMLWWWPANPHTAAGNQAE
jgi:fucose permease